MLPIGYAVKSISYDGIDLPGVERNIVQIVQNRVEVVLAKKRSPAFTVSGRVLSAVGTYSASRPIVRMQSVASSNSGKRQPKLVWTPQSVGGTAYAALAPDGTFAFQQVPVGTYSVGESNSIEVTDHDVTGLEVQLFGGKKKGDLNSPESQALFFRIQLVAAANSVDCGVYDAYVPGSDAVMECIDTAMRQNRPFTVISTFAGTDTLSVGGFFRDSSGAIQVLNGCLLMCSGWIVEPCSSPRKLFSNRGILVCEQPLGAMPLWPPPKSNAEGK
jgi:hypothetical protein